jgi:hypothetical protein
MWEMEKPTVRTAPWSQQAPRAHPIAQKFISFVKDPLRSP